MTILESATRMQSYRGTLWYKQRSNPFAPVGIKSAAADAVYVEFGHVKCNFGHLHAELAFPSAESLVCRVNVPFQR